MRAALFFICLTGAAFAAEDPPPRDAESWAKLIAAAKARGGVETQLDKSSSYVFQQEDGNFVTLTQWRSTPPKRFVCTIAKDQKSTVCVRWETGQTTYGERADAASPWKTRVGEALADTQPSTPAGELLGQIGKFVGAVVGQKPRYVFGRPVYN